jgi:hypothetical protein
MTGAFSGLMGAIIVGPRVGKFNDIRTGIPIVQDSQQFDNQEYKEKYKNKDTQYSEIHRKFINSEI